MTNNDSIDKDAILAAMHELADEAGDWKVHIPYATAIEFCTSDRVRELYGDHVEGCRYCREVLSTFHPCARIE